ncbi:MAG TPA: tryptophan 7-halogenase [Verrucomicrobiota bacterium]|nr:FAD-dependent oxidoreductase [Verrucomicrobiales bacterium]HRI14096.1 tryptophan 7-halogenase [Verrucomicrobiota bacterium]
MPNLKRVDGRVFDLAVVGSAFGGSLMAMIARRLGRSVVMIERGKHPRFAIGESSTPLTNLLLEELAGTYDLPRIRAFSKWGSWQRTHPEIGCGLKRGFSFYHHEFGQVWRPRPERDNELLVAASPNDELSDTHWYRPDFDAFLVREAQEMGVTLWDETELREFDESPSGIRVAGIRRGAPVECQARFLVDASGPRGFVWRRLGLPETDFENFPKTQALYSHFRGVIRWDRIQARSERPPHPPDDAALHHVFPGGWMWVLRFNNGLTSAGVSVDESLGQQLGLSAGSDAWARLLDRLPSVAAQFRSAQPVREFAVQDRLTFFSPVTTGTRWAMLPSAAGFVDPLLSTGFPLTLFGIERLGRMFSKGLVPTSEELKNYEKETTADLTCVAELVGAMLKNLGRAEVFQRLGMLYFAAASYAESARRLGRPILAPGFLLRDRAEFRMAMRELCAWSRCDHLDRPGFGARVVQTIDPVNVAGLCETSKRNWYGVDWADLVAARDKLDASAAEVDALRIRLGIPQ